ncbi:DUF262 domain-containing protein [Serratia plymuthica]|uniref:DUF262 domain-containing protein n=1 Tax=Serratia plymuthica TaxID=82996 RepID=UPI0018E4B785|nr:DUF262 domain-containing protein [Serratia plymuthica]MBI6136425.1 DUF262 domain-containing protein [Serratia plymuthica]
MKKKIGLGNEDTTSSLEELNSAGRGTGLEVESDDLGQITDVSEPFDPEKIDVDTRSFTVDLLLSRLRYEELSLQPDFQRRSDLWPDSKQSRLIESIILNIPLPNLYFSEVSQNDLAVIDGVQRLTTICRFVNHSYGVKYNFSPLTLTGMEYLTELNGLEFNDLPRFMQRRITETQIVVHVIKKQTPEEVKFNIFKRINTGGLSLSPQEIRNALYSGKARNILKRMVETKEFVDLTEGKIQSERMGDHEIALRFAAFHSKGYKNYTGNNLDSFLMKTMNEMQKFTKKDENELIKSFKNGLKNAHKIFGPNAFRKYTGDTRRSPINKSIFEVQVTLCSKLTTKEVNDLFKKRDVILNSLQTLLLNNKTFFNAVTQGTGLRERVINRFTEFERILGIEHD